MDREDAQQALEMLCMAFKLPVPKLVCPNSGAGTYTSRGPTKNKYENKRAYRHYKDPTQCVIALGLNQRFGLASVEAVLLHEFSHYLCHSRREFQVGCTGDHDVPFSRALTDTVKWWYAGDLSKYPWEKEYACVRKRGALAD